MNYYKYLLYVFLFLCITKCFISQCEAQIITRIAGNYTYGYTGDGGAATSASISEPYGVAIDKAGNMYFSDMGHNIIRKVDANGIISTFAGSTTLGYTGDGATAKTARLYHPTVVCVDNLNNVYFADQNAAVIRKVNSTGIISTIAGRVDRTYYSPDGTPALNAYMGAITCIKADNLGNIYVSDYYNHVIRKISSAGILSTIAGKVTLAIAGYYTGGFSGDGGLATNAELKDPYEISFDKNGNAYIADAINYRIRKIDPSGIITTIAGNGIKGYSGDGGLAINAQLNIPTGVIADESGNIYITDQINNRIRKVDNAGIITTVVGNGTFGYSGDGGPAVNAQIREPWSASFDNSGNLIFGEGEYESAIRKVTLCFQIAATTGVSSLCVGANNNFVNSTPGGTWNTSNTAIASVDINGKVTGVSPGNATITYTVTNGNCTVTAPLTVNINAAPSLPPITGSRTICSGLNTTLSNAVAGGIWNTNASSIATIDIAGNVKGISQGLATISYSLSNACGSAQVSKTVTVNPIPAVAPIDGPTQVCAGSAITLNNPTTGGKWSVGTTIASISQSGVLTAFTTGTVFVNYQITNLGCEGSTTLTVTINPIPVVQELTGNAILCLNNSTQLSNTTKGGVWSSTDPMIIKTDQSGFITAVSTGNASINYTITSPGCGTASASKPITVSSLPNVKYNLPSICLPDGRGNFENLSTIPDGSDPLLTYEWNFGDASDLNISNLKNPTHKYSSTGPYFVKLVVTSKEGCKDSLTQRFTKVYPQPKADFQLSALEICADQQVSFTNFSNGMGFPITTYHWAFSKGDSSFLQNPVHIYHDSGVVNASLYIFNSQGCISDTIVKQVLVHPYPKLIMGNGQGGLQGGTLMIQPKYYYGKGLTFLWSPATYLDSTTIVAPHTSPQENITYRLTLTGIGGCSVTDTIAISVLKTPIIPNVFSPNGDGINDKWKIKYLESYPDADIQVFNRNGQIIFRSKGYSKEWDGTFNGMTVPVATYYYVIDPKNGRPVLTGSVTILK